LSSPARFASTRDWFCRRTRTASEGAQSTMTPELAASGCHATAEPDQRRGEPSLAG
jgi:hypothetical protein